MQRKESRKHSRFGPKRSVKFLILDGSGAEETSQILNISREGLLLTSRRNIEPDTLLNVQIKHPDNKNTLNVNAKVIWTNPAHDSKGVYYTGVSFPDIKEDIRSLIL